MEGTVSDIVSIREFGLSIGWCTDCRGISTTWHLEDSKDLVCVVCTTWSVEGGGGVLKNVRSQETVNSSSDPARPIYDLIYYL